MYRCQKCNNLSTAKEKQNKLVVETRNVSYTNKVIVNEKPKEIQSTGWEIVREIKVCNSCYETRNN